MKVNVENRVAHIRLEEDLIAPNVIEFKEEIISQIENLDDIEKILVDLEKTENIDSVGVTFIISLYKIADRDNKNFKIKGSSDDIMQLFKLMKHDFFDLE